LTGAQVLFPKSRKADIMRVQDDFDEMDKDKAEKEESGPVEVEVNSKLEWNQQVGVIVATMMDQGDKDVVGWIQKVGLNICKDV
jgi:hypothetical protein